MLGQTYANWELIIVDDCSIDGTWEAATQLAKTNPRIRVYKNTENMGISQTRQRAVELSTGELIGHLDSDDILERWAIEEMTAVLTAYPEVGLAYSDFSQIGVNSEVQHYNLGKPFDVNKLHQHGWRHFGVYRRVIFDSVGGFNKELRTHCEDGDLFMKIAEQYKCLWVPKILYYYRSHGTNTTSAKPQCDVCTLRPKCNYMRVWSKSAKYDPLTFTPLKDA
jgi:glycosyltransferase involved in cell wall biosynthesis